MKHLSRVIVFIFLPIICSSQQKETDTIQLFYLGGQSNMDGYGYNKDLPKELNKEFKNIWIFHGNTVPDGETKNAGMGIWSKLNPGHGRGFGSDGKINTYSDRFGIELSFAKRIQELYPNKKIAFIKYSRGGTSIDSLAAGTAGSWDVDFKGKNGINQYDHYLSTIKNAFNVKDINKDGKEDYLIPTGIIWMQGEGDAVLNESVANNYYFNLKQLMNLIRASLLVDDLPVVIGKISDSWNNEQGKVWKYGELVQYAQEKYVREDVNAAIVKDTRYYKYSDPWHYDSQGYIDLGIKFAEAIYSLNEN